MITLCLSGLIVLCLIGLDARLRNLRPSKKVLYTTALLLLGYAIFIGLTQLRQSCTIFLVATTLGIPLAGIIKDSYTS